MSKFLPPPLIKSPQMAMLSKTPPTRLPPPHTNNFFSLDDDVDAISFHTKVARLIRKLAFNNQKSFVRFSGRKKKRTNLSITFVWKGTKENYGKKTIEKIRKYEHKFHSRGEDRPCDAKFSEKSLWSHNDNTALIKQISLFGTAFVMKKS